MRNIFFTDQQTTDMQSFALRSWMQQLQSIDRDPPTRQELTQIYATCVIAYRAANKRGDAVALVPMVIKDKAGETLSDTNPVVRALNRNYRENLKRSEITLCYWGKNLLVKRRAYSDVPYSLRWVNPNLWTTDVQWGGLRGFRINRSSRYSGIDERYVKPKDAVFQHGFDFHDDFDGVAPAEAAFLAEQMTVEMAQTQLSFMQNRAIPAAIVQPAQGVTGTPEDKERDRMEGMLQRLFKGGKNAGRTMLQRFRWEWLQLTANFDDVKFDTHYEQAYESVAIAFDIPIALIRESASNYAQAEVARRDWGQSWLVPRMEWYAESFTEQLCNEPVIVKRFGQLKVEPDTSNVAILKEDQTALVTRVNAQVDGGYEDLYQAALRTGIKKPPEELKGMYMWGGMPTPISEIQNLWKYKQLVSPSVYNSELITGEPLPQPIDPNQVVPTDTGTEPVTSSAIGQQPLGAGKEVALPPPKPPIVGSDACVMIGVQNHPDLVALQKRISSLYPDKQIKWNDPGSFHITLAYIPVATDAQIAMLRSALAEVDLPDLMLKLGRLDCFDNVGEHALHFRVSKNAGLSEFQAEIHDLCVACGMAVSQHHEPGAYTPHITMGYSAEKLPTVMYHGKVRVNPVDLQLGIESNVPYRRPWREEDQPEPPPQRRFIPDDQHKELRSWQALLSRKGLDYPFEVKVLPARAALWIETALDLGYDTQLIFDTVRSLMLADNYDAEPDETPSIVEAWKTAKRLTGAKSYTDTREQFITEMLRVIGAGQAEESTRRAFAGAMRAALRRYGLIAFRDGMNDVGYDPESLSDGEVAMFRAWQDEQSGYVTALGAEVFKQGISAAEVEQRARMWADVSLHSIYMRGVVAGNKTVHMMWSLGQAEEHCGDCPRLDGQVRTAEFWMKANLYPGSLKTECKHGCQCGLVITDRPLTKGKLPRLAGRSMDLLDQLADEFDKLTENEAA